MLFFALLACCLIIIHKTDTFVLRKVHRIRKFHSWKNPHIVLLLGSLPRVCVWACAGASHTHAWFPIHSQKGAHSKRWGGVLELRGAKSQGGEAELNAVTFSLVIHYFSSSSSNNKCNCTAARRKTRKKNIGEKARATHTHTATRGRERDSMLIHLNTKCIFRTETHLFA